MSETQKKLYNALREARRDRGMTQAELAEKIGAKQAAVSMYERGQVTALSHHKVLEMGKLLGVDVKAFAAGRDPVSGKAMIRKICPTYDCPTNYPFMAGGQACVMPFFAESVANEKTRCRLCSEVLLSRCPTTGCEAPLVEGAACQRCGQQYVKVELDEGQLPAEWVREQRASIRELRRMAPGVNILLGRAETDDD